MKKVWMYALSAVLLLAVVFSLASCGKTELAVGKEMIRYESQLDTLTALDNGSIDVSVIDSVMAGYYTSTGEFAAKICTVKDLVLATETYGVAGRKEDKALISAINDSLIKLYGTGTYAAIAERFGLSGTLSIDAGTANPLVGATDDSLDKVRLSGKIVIGYTVFAPIAYTENGVLTGFDIELAKAVCEDLGVQAEFQEINWDSKEALLANGTIDLVWNGLTITEERSANMCISVPYLYNKQVAVVLKEDADRYTTAASMADAVIGVEGGSAGEDVVSGQ